MSKFDDVTPDSGDYYAITLPSGKKARLEVPAPLSAADKQWLIQLLDLIAPNPPDESH